MKDKNHTNQQDHSHQYQEYERLRTNKKKKGWLMGCGGCLVLLILIVIGISACSALFTDTGLNTSKKSKSSTSKSYKIGQTAKNGNLEVTVHSVSTSKQVGPSVVPTTAKGTFVIADVEVKNKGNKALTIDSHMFKLKSGDKSLEADSTASLSANQDDNGSIQNSFFLDQINPDSIAKGKVVFDVSDNIANDKNKKLEITSSLFSIKNVTFDLSSDN